MGQAATPQVPWPWIKVCLLVAVCALITIAVAVVRATLALTRVANRLDSLLARVEPEVPDALAAVRLASMELGDCLGEFGAIGSDLGSSVRLTTQSLAEARQGVQIAAAGTKALASKVVQPALGKHIPAAKGKVESALKARQSLPSTLQQVAQNARQTKKYVQQVRTAAAAVQLVAAVKSAQSSIPMRALFTRIARGDNTSKQKRPPRGSMSQ